MQGCNLLHLYLFDGIYYHTNWRILWKTFKGEFSSGVYQLPLKT